MRLLFPLFFCFALTASAQRLPALLSDSAQLSLITVAPGEYVYSTFGHSALRVHDLKQGFDVCFNYGTFEFEQPNFLLKFARGRLLYFLDLETYRSFEGSNRADARNMREQLFNMGQPEKQRLWELLRDNAREENRYYKYDFFYDNCATRIRDIVNETYSRQLVFDSTSIPKGATMRQLLQPYLVPHPWMRFGIDLLLGLPADRKATTQDFMFLPDYMHDLFATAKKPDGAALVERERSIEARYPLSFHPGLLGHPLLILCVVALIGLLSMAHPRAERIFDVVFWFTLGFAGLLMALLWFATDHSATKTNLNLLWAWPTHLLFFWRSRSRWGEKYFFCAGILAFLTLVLWAFLPQQLPVAAIPLVVLAAVKGLWPRLRKWRRAEAP